MRQVDEFFREIDDGWAKRSLENVRLHVIGCSALLLQTDYERGTRDADIFQATDLSAEAKQHLLDLAGRDTEIANRRHMHVEVVANGIPFLPLVPVWRPMDRVNRMLQCIEVVALDAVDVVVSKLVPFRASDKQDIEAMIERELIEHAMLVARFRSAVDLWKFDARGENLPRYIRNLNEVERDMLAVPESEIELPSWI